MTPIPQGNREMSTTFEEQRAEFVSSRMLALPISGAIAWLVAGISGLVFPGRTFLLSMVLFGAIGSIFYLALFIQRFTGEDLLGRKSTGNIFDRIFLAAIVQALAGFAIAIPFFMIDRTSLPLSLGVITSLMWIPLSAIINHWVGYAHFALRMVGTLALWYAFEDHRFVTIPFWTVLVYLTTLPILLRRNITES
jgi:hypothetical protein